MQILRLPLGNTSYIIQMKNLSALKDLDHQVGIDYLQSLLGLTPTRSSHFRTERCNRIL